MSEPVVVLTSREREHFARWLRQDASESLVFAGRWDARLPDGSAVSSRFRQEAKACMVIVYKLLSMDAQTIE